MNSGAVWCKDAGVVRGPAVVFSVSHLLGLWTRQAARLLKGQESLCVRAVVYSLRLV